MTITIDDKLEKQIRERAEAEGVSVSAYVEQLVAADQSAEYELEALALAGLNSGPIEPSPGYWGERRGRLADRLNKTAPQ